MQYMKAHHRRSTSWRILTVTTVWNTGETGDIDGGSKDAPLRKTNIKKLWLLKFLTQKIPHPNTVMHQDSRVSMHEI